MLLERGDSLSGANRRHMAVEGSNRPLNCFPGVHHES